MLQSISIKILLSSLLFGCICLAPKTLAAQSQVIPTAKANFCQLHGVKLKRKKVEIHFGAYCDIPSNDPDRYPHAIRDLCKGCCRTSRAARQNKTHYCTVCESVKQGLTPTAHQ